MKKYRSGADVVETASSLPFSKRFRDTDLQMLDAIWNLQAVPICEMRPSDRKSSRQGLEALDRIGNRLLDILKPEGAMRYYALPNSDFTSRFRFVPSRLWLEFLFEESSNKAEDMTKIFVEFSAKKFTIGLSVLVLSSDEESRAFWRRFQNEAPSAFQEIRYAVSEQPDSKVNNQSDASSWKVSYIEAPVRQEVYTSDVNTWLAQQFMMNSKKGRSFTISKVFRGEVPSFEILSNEITDTVKRFCPSSLVNCGPSKSNNTS